MLFEVKNKVYGQVVSAYSPPRFLEHPITEVDPDDPITDLEYETAANIDPLTVVCRVLEGLENVCSRLGDFEPILDEIDAVDDCYQEAKKRIVRDYATPLTDLHGLPASIQVF